MIARTSIKDDKYFEKYILEHEEIISESYDDLERGEVAPKQVASFKSHLCSSHVRLLVAKYSAGRPTGGLRDQLAKVLDLLVETWDFPDQPKAAAYYWDTYPEFLWILSIFYLLGIDQAAAQPLVIVARKAKERDWLVELLLKKSVDGHELNTHVTFPKPYASLKMAVEETDPQKRSAILRHYLEKEWYPGHKGVYWHDNHKSKHDTFFGYWSFEAAAVVKIAGIDDSSFRDHPYYPKDMLG